jgi:hypothetical protein
MAHFEVVEIAPPLGALEAMLAACAYGERNEASGQGGDTPGCTWEELTQRVQCSNKELAAALRRLHALELNGRWMTLEPGEQRLYRALCVRVLPASSALANKCSAASPQQPTCAACLTWSSSPPARTHGRCWASRATR